METLTDLELVTNDGDELVSNGDFRKIKCDITEFCTFTTTRPDFPSKYLITMHHGDMFIVVEKFMLNCEPFVKILTKHGLAFGLMDKMVKYSENVL